MSRFLDGNRIFFTVCVLAFSCRFSTAADDISGQTGFAFLNIPTGARATAMGQAFTSVPNDIQGLPYNPASLATLTAGQASFQHLSYIEDTSQDALAIGLAGRDERPSWGAQANYFRVSKIERTQASLQPTGDGFTSAGDFSTYDLLLGLTVANQFFDGVSAGTTIKLLRESLADASANGAAVDFGFLYQAMDERAWNAGVSLLNAGTSSKFADAAVKLPLTLRAGLSGQPFAQWMLSTDYMKRTDTKGEFNVGAEVTPRRFFSIRVGYRYQVARPDYGSFADFSGGLGIRYKSLSLDYAYAPLGDLGSTHRVSFNMRFSPSRN